MKLKQYYQCGDCKNIFEMLHTVGADLSIQNPCCDYVKGKNSERDKSIPTNRTMWPSLSIGHMLKIVQEHNTVTFDDRRVAIIFLSAALEAMLLELNYRLLSYYIASSHFADKVIFDKYSGRNGLINLYKKLNTESIPKILQDNDMKFFTTDWDTLVRSRNQIAHGSFFHGLSQEIKEKKETKVLHGEQFEIELITRILETTLPAFRLLHNEMSPRETYEMQRL